MFKDFNARIGRVVLIELAYKLALPPIDPAAPGGPGKVAYFATLRFADAGDLAALNDVWLDRLQQSRGTVTS